MYTHKKISAARLAAMILRASVALLKLWPFVALAALLLSPVSPHMLWSYRYQDVGSVRIYYRCTYLGAGGFVPYMRGDDCPALIMLKRKPLMKATIGDTP